MVALLLLGKHRESLGQLSVSLKDVGSLLTTPTPPPDIWLHVHPPPFPLTPTLWFVDWAGFPGCCQVPWNAGTKDHTRGGGGT